MTPVERQERQAQIRHYDTIHWVITGIMLAAMGSLALKSFDARRHSYSLNIAGILISFAGLYYIACFRRWMQAIRQSISDQPESLRTIEDSSYIALMGQLKAVNPTRTWTVLVFSVGVIDLLGFLRWLPPFNCECSAAATIGIGIAIFGVLNRLWAFGNE